MGAESEWKYFRKVREAALQVLCERILAEIEQASRASSKSAHERYLSVFDLVQDRNDDIARAFDDPKRSAFFEQLAQIRHLDLLTEEQWAGFSESTRYHVEGLVTFIRSRSRRRR